MDVYFQDVTGCGGSTYQVPGDGGPDSVHRKARSWTAPRCGIPVFSAGHQHDGAIDITLKDGTTGSEYCKGVATYHENPRHLATSTDACCTTRSRAATPSR